ncbi:MAG: hypothetical protein R3212_00735 [Xanthomonadales bacterium]|nr:hypothetical protein [Xanthomonadales bacterium]
MTDRENGKMTEAELLRQLGELPRRVAPRNDPWPQIERRIRAERRAPAVGAPAWFRLAAAVALALALGVFLGRNLAVAPQGPSAAMVPAQAGSSAETLPNFGAAVAGAELEYQAAFSEFVKIGRSASDLKPATLDAIQRDWQEMLDAESALSTALAQYPNNAWLNKRMLELRERQLAMLKQLAGLDRVSRRTET